MCIHFRMSLEQFHSVIECFCQILSFNGFSILSSDIFYLAQYDKNEAVRINSRFKYFFLIRNLFFFYLQTIPLWKLLFEMIQFDINSFDLELSKTKFVQLSKGICRFKHTYFLLVRINQLCTQSTMALIA